MTLRVIDGFGLYGSQGTVTTSGKWDSSSSLNSGWLLRQPGPFAQNSYSITSPAATISSLTMTLGNRSWWASGIGGTPLIIGIRLKRIVSRNSAAVLALLGSGGGYGWMLVTSSTDTTTPALQLHYLNSSGSDSGTQVGTSSFSYTMGAWDYHEFKWIPLGGASYQLVWRVNGTQVFDSGSVTGWGTTGTTYSNFYLGTVSSPTNTSSTGYADLYIADGAGSVNNNFVGDIRVETLYPSTDGAHSDFTNPAGTNLLSANQWGMETGATTGWAFRGSGEATAIATAGVTMAGTSATFAASTSFSYEGSYSMSMQGTGGNVAYQTTGGTSGIAVSGTTTYSVAWRNHNAGATASYTPAVVWYDSGGAIISASVGSAQGATNTIDATGWTSISGTFTSPSNAAFAAMVVIVLSTNNGVVYADGMGLYANGNGAQFRAPSDTSHYTQVNDPYNDGDSTFLVTSTVTNTESFAMADLGSTSGTPVAVLATSVIRKETATPRTVSNLVRISATDYVGTAFTVNNDLAYHGYSTIWETNPNTSTTWTISNVNALEAGIQLES